MFLSLLFAIILKGAASINYGFIKGAAYLTLQLVNNCRLYNAVTFLGFATACFETLPGIDCSHPFSFLSIDGKISIVIVVCRVSMCVNSKSFPYTNTYTMC